MVIVTMNNNTLPKDIKLNVSSLKQYAIQLQRELAEYKGLYGTLPSKVAPKYCLSNQEELAKVYNEQSS